MFDSKEHVVNHKSRRKHGAGVMFFKRMSAVENFGSKPCFLVDIWTMNISENVMQAPLRCNGRVLTKSSVFHIEVMQRETITGRDQLCNPVHVVDKTLAALPECGHTLSP